MGVANDRSIGWGIAAAAAGQGAELAFTYQGDALKKRVNPLAGSVGSDIVLPCDVTDEVSVDLVFNTLKEKWASSIFLCMRLPILTRKSLKAAILIPAGKLSKNHGNFGLFVYCACQTGS